MRLLYDNEYWDNILGRDARKLALENRLHLVFSLIIYLQISLAKFFLFIFTSTVVEVRARTSRFMGYTPTAVTEDTKFPPGMIFRAWLERFPDAQKHLEKVVGPFMQVIAEKESDKMIRDVELKVKMKTLTLKGIQELLQPQQIIDKYRELAPFTWDLLHTFAATPNKFRRRKAQNMSNSPDDGDDDWEDDPNLADDEPMNLKMWNTTQTPEGFARNPVLVGQNL